MIHECDNCGGVFPERELAEIKKLFVRIDRGGEVPSGECPDCGALCYEREAKSLKRQFWLLTLANPVVNFGAAVERQFVCPTYKYALRVAGELTKHLNPEHGKGFDICSVDERRGGVVYENESVLILLTRLK